jgi:hypothetical protein
MITRLDLDPYYTIIDEDVLSIVNQFPRVKSLRITKCTRLTNTALDLFIESYGKQLEEFYASKSFNIGHFELSNICTICPELKVFGFQKIYGWKPSLLEYVLVNFPKLVK